MPKGQNRVELFYEPDVVSSDAERLQVNGVSVFDDHLDGLEVSVHGHVDACDGAVNLGPVLQLDRDRLMREFHQESASQIKTKNK